MKLNRDTYFDIIENLHEGLYSVDLMRVITYWNKAAEHITGFTAEEVVGTSCADNILTHVDGLGSNLCQGACPLSITMVSGQTHYDEIFLHHKQGHRVPVSIRVRPLRADGGEIIGAVEIFTDLSERVTTDLRIRELESLAMLDDLTRLANRHYTERELGNRIQEHHRFKVPFGVFFIDIDNFKIFNDTYGHAIGDDILRVVADTLSGNSRPFDLYGRWGGEEFVGILRNITLEHMEKLGDRLRMLVENSYMMHEGEKLQVTISVGTTMYRDGESLVDLVNRADGFMYAAKKAGRNLVKAG